MRTQTNIYGASVRVVGESVTGRNGNWEEYSAFRFTNHGLLVGKHGLLAKKIPTPTARHPIRREASNASFLSMPPRIIPHIGVAKKNIETFDELCFDKIHW